VTGLAHTYPFAFSLGTLQTGIHKIRPANRPWARLHLSMPDGRNIKPQADFHAAAQP